MNCLRIYALIFCSTILNLLFMYMLLKEFHQDSYLNFGFESVLSVKI